MSSYTSFVLLHTCAILCSFSKRNFNHIHTTLLRTQFRSKINQFTLKCTSSENSNENPISIKKFSIQKYFHSTKLLTLLFPAFGTQNNPISSSVNINQDSNKKSSIQYLQNLASEPEIGNNRFPVQTIIPLDYVDNVYCMKYIIYNNNYKFRPGENDNDKNVVANNRFTIYRGIIDTGSPFLIVPSICTYMWGKGCLNRYKSVGLDDSAISYGGQEYNARWRTGNFSFFYKPLISPLYTMFGTLFGMDDGALTSLTLSSFQNPKYKLIQRKYQLNEPKYPIVFGTVGSEIMNPPGGCFVGLIKYTNKIENQMTSSFLDQLGYSSFEFNTQNGYLKLSKTPLITSNSLSNSIANKTVIKLTDLRTVSSVPVNHYTALISDLKFNGKSVDKEVYDTIYAIFDTGLSGCIVSLPLAYDEKTPQPIRQVSVTLNSEVNGETITLQARASHDDVFVVSTGNITWFDSIPNTAVTFKATSDSSRSHTNPMYANIKTIDINNSTSGNNDIHTNDAFIHTYNYSNHRNKMITDTDTDSISTQVISSETNQKIRKKSFKPQVIILGLAFFKNMSMIVDCDTQRLSIEQF